MHQNRQWGCVDDYRNKKRAFEQMKDLYAPLRSLDVKPSFTGDQVSVDFQLKPRQILDIPAFTLNDYRLVWEVKDKDGKTESGGLFKLPAIVPGSQTLNFTANWKKTNETALMKVTLLSPTGYNVKDTILYFTKPLSPKVLSIIHASRSVRVVFERNESATEYVLNYTANGVTKTTASTIDHYIDLTGLPAEVLCQLSVVGINTLGEGEPSQPFPFMPQNGNQSLPPVIWLIEACNSGCSIGLGWVYSDQYYEVRYTTTPFDASSWKSITTRTFGAIRVPELKNGKTYYLQVSSYSQGGGSRSKWSELLEVTPSTTALKGVPKLNGILQQGAETVLSVNPAKNASGYKISYETDGKQTEELINRSEIEYVLLRKVGKGGVKNLTISAF
jgi:beta-galactosidase